MDFTECLPFCCLFRGNGQFVTERIGYRFMEDGRKACQNYQVNHSFGFFLVASSSLCHNASLLSYLFLIR